MIGRSLPLLAAAVAAIFAVGALGLALVWRSADRASTQKRLEEGRLANCVVIETLKAQLRPELFSVSNTKRILVDLHVDPESATGKRLIAQSRASNERQRRQLAPSEC